MTARLAIPALCCAFTLSLATAQTADAPKPAPPDQAKPAAPAPDAKPSEEKKAPETPPDLKAYREANKETDPEKKIAALEKFKADFPESNMRVVAESTILSTLVTKFPSREARIRQFAAAMYKTAPEKDKGFSAYNIANQFLDANLLLKDAQGYARKGVDAMRLSTYLQEQLAGYEKRKQKPPSSEALQKRFLSTRAPRIAVLGRIELKLGHASKGKKLLEEAYAADKENPAVLSELGALAAKSGDDRKALEFLVPAKLSGRATKGAAEAFEAVYKKEHNGSIEGLDAMLDGEYNKRFPNPVKVEAYKPTEKRSDRVVLAEVFTGSGCPPCAGADLAFDAAMARYSHKDFAVLMYHLHIPRPDPMTNLEVQARAKSYDVNAVPSFAIDGKKTGGGGGRDQAKSIYDRFNKDIEKDLESPAEAHITIGAGFREKSVDVNAIVKGAPADSKDLKVYIALVEKDLRFNGENGIRFHPMVVRAIASFGLAGDGSFRHTFDLDEISRNIKDHLDDYEAKGHRGESFKFAEKKFKINPADLAVVVFVQDDKSKHVLQAAYVDQGGDVTHPTLEANNAR